VGAGDLGKLVELDPAGEPVGQHHCVAGRTHCGQQGSLGDDPQDLVVTAVHAEVPCQPAAAAARGNLGVSPGEQLGVSVPTAAVAAFNVVGRG